MVKDITRLDSPIDVMGLMHKAFRAVSERVEKLAAQSEGGGNLKAFTAAYQFWIKQLLHHATAEDQYMTAQLVGCQPARDNETEHAELARQGGDLVAFLEKGDAAGLEENVRAAMASLEQEQHRKLTDKVQEVETALKTALGETKVAARTRRHLYRRVVGLRILEYDHFENEEAFVCSLVRERMTEREQLELTRHLLIDDKAENPRWIIDWVAGELLPRERKLLDDLDGRFAEVVINTHRME